MSESGFFDWLSESDSLRTCQKVVFFDWLSESDSLRTCQKVVFFDWLSESDSLRTCQKVVSLIGCQRVIPLERVRKWFY